LNGNQDHLLFDFQPTYSKEIYNEYNEYKEDDFHPFGIIAGRSADRRLCGSYPGSGTR
jgi:hypothetical protein